MVWTVKPEDDPKGIGTVNTTLSRATYIGLIGDLAKDGVVKNVNIAADCKYEAFASVGSIVGYNYGLIENCRNYADVFGFSSWIGGITGQSAKGGVIRNCFNAGEVSTGYRNVGGITVRRRASWRIAPTQAPSMPSAVIRLQAKTRFAMPAALRVA